MNEHIQLIKARKDLQTMLADVKHFESTQSEHQGRDYEELDMMYTQLDYQEDEIKNLESTPAMVDYDRQTDLMWTSRYVTQNEFSFEEFCFYH